MALMGRPPTYRARTRVVLYVEAAEAEAMAACARGAGYGTTAAWMRQGLVEATVGDRSRVPRRWAARGADTVEQEGDRPHGREGRAGAGGGVLPAPGTGNAAAG